VRYHLTGQAYAQDADKIKILEEKVAFLEKLVQWRLQENTALKKENASLKKRLEKIRKLKRENHENLLDRLMVLG